MEKCTEALRDKLRGLSKYQAIEDENYTIGFLRPIKQAAFKSKAHKNIHVSLWNTKKRTMNTYYNHLEPVQ